MIIHTCQKPDYQLLSMVSCVLGFEIHTMAPSCCYDLLYCLLYLLCTFIFKYWFSICRMFYKSTMFNWQKENYDEIRPTVKLQIVTKGHCCIHDDILVKYDRKTPLRWYLTLQGGNSILTYRDQWSVLKVRFNFKRLADTDVQCSQNGRCADGT